MHSIIVTDQTNKLVSLIYENRTYHQQLRQQLRREMEFHYNVEDLHILCFDLVIEYENFASSKSLMIIGIIESCERKKELITLLGYLGKEKLLQRITETN